MKVFVFITVKYEIIFIRINIARVRIRVMVSKYDKIKPQFFTR